MFEDEEPTEEQRDAYEALSRAVQHYHHVLGDHGLVMDWALVSSLNSPQADGQDQIRTVCIGSSGQPSYRTLGLLDYGRAIVKSRIWDSMGGL